MKYGETVSENGSALKDGERVRTKDRNGGQLTAAWINPGLEVVRGCGVAESGPVASGRSVSWPPNKVNFFVTSFFSAVHANVLMCCKSDRCLSIRSNFLLPAHLLWRQSRSVKWLSIYLAQGEANERAQELTDLPLLGVPSGVNSVILKFKTREWSFKVNAQHQQKGFRLWTQFKWWQTITSRCEFHLCVYTKVCGR